MMLYIIWISLWSLSLSIASSVPQQTPFSNLTTASSLGAPETTNCPIQCRRKLERLDSLTWSPKTVTATFTVETVLLVVNKRYNSTRTSRITNTEVDLTGYTPAADVDSAGTRTTAIVITTSSTVSTHKVTFPTNFYADYPSSYTICGTLPTAVSGVATCIKHPCLDPGDNYNGQPNYFDSGAPVFAYPSHSPVPQTSSFAAIRGADLKGLTYEAVWGTVDDIDDILLALFPSLAKWKCVRGNMASPDEVKNAALYLTATTTSMDNGESDTLGLPHTTSASTASQSLVSEAAITFPETSPGNVPTSKAAVQVTSANGINASKQAPSIPSADAATASSEIASSNVHASAGEKTSPSRILGSEQGPSLPLTTTRLPLIASIENPAQTAATASVGIAISSVVSSAAQLSPVTFSSSVVSTSPRIPENEAASIVLNSHTISRDANAQYLVSGQPLIPGSPVTLDSGADAMPVVIHTSSSQIFLVVGSSTSTLAGIPTSAAAQALSIGTQVLAANSENVYVVGTQTLAPGVPITLGSGDAATPVVLHTSSSHTIVVFGSRTQTLLAGFTPLVAAAPAALTIGSQILGANSGGGYIFGSQTLAPGSPITLGSGSSATPVLLQTTSSNTVLVIGSSTSTLVAAAIAIPQPLTIGSQVISINSQNQYIVGSQTLTPGSPITLGSGVAGTPVLLQTSGSQTVLVAGSITSALAGAATAPPPFTIGSQVVTANAQDQYVVGSQTLTPGAAITVAGMPVSLAPSGTQVVVGTSTAGLGNYIMSGLGAGPSAGASASASASVAVPFKGAAGRQFQIMRTSAIWGSAMAVLMVWL